MNSESNVQPAFSEADERLLQTIAGQLAAGIDEVRSLEEIQRLAITDSLTGLNNRRHFFELARKEFARARRYRRPLVTVMFDLDKLKHINETFGHAGGDTALEMVAKIWKNELRDADIFGRYGGDEFAAILPETKLDEGVKVAERVSKKIEKTQILLNGRNIKLTTSIGVSVINNDAQNVEEMIELADRGLFEANKLGGNCVCMYKEKGTK